MPYVLPAGSNPATTAVQLRLDTPRLFSLMTPFWYAPERPLPAGLDAALPATAPDPPDDSARWLKVGDERRPPLTDLASVPGVLWGLIASYGRHTLAVLVHDRLSAYADEGAEGERFVRQTAADEVFFQALRDPGRPERAGHRRHCFGREPRSRVEGIRAHELTQRRGDEWRAVSSHGRPPRSSSRLVVRLYPARRVF